MKIRSLLLSMLVVAGFSACSDDVIDNGGNEVGTTDATPAYLTISFSANSSGSSRSTADDANNIGDKDGDQEDSGHHNDGTAAENAVNTALIIASPVSGNVGYAHYYPNMSGTIDGLTKSTSSSDTWATDESIPLATGEYKILVVINPTASILSINPKVQSEGLTDGNSVRELYNAIVDGRYVDDETHYAEAFWKGTVEGQTQGFTMTNQAESCDEDGNSVVLTEEHTTDNPQKAIVKVERVLSKITFRPKSTQGLADNVYEVKVNSNLHIAAKTMTITVDGNSKSVNIATDAKGTTVYPYYEKENGSTVLKAVYGEVNDEMVELTGRTEDETEEAGKNYYVKPFELQYNDAPESEDGTVKWYVKLEKYALVNLSKEQFYVRHTIVNNNTEPVPFGTLNGSNYLYTPYWKDKNAADYSDDTETGFATGVDPTKWFIQTLKQVANESLKTENQLYYKAIPGTTTYENDEDVVKVNGKIDGEDGQHPGDAAELEKIGNFLTYCYENSTDEEHQNHGLSTGISFQAKIYSAPSCGENDAITELYRYNNHLFESITAIYNAYNGEVSEEIKALFTGTGEDMQEKENITAAELQAAKIAKYNSNTCYYYTTEIKHFDNGLNTVLGNMEFAIMRNNIYSLAVTGIKNIGDPFVDPTPNIPNESTATALSVEVQIVPWIVRYHDIEF